MFFKSVNVFFILCGASYIIIVFSDLLISSNFSFLNFLFNGKKPKKVNSFVSNPDAIKAFTNAHAPGIGITSIFSSIAFFITSSPGSQIPGVPASDTNAIFSPLFNFSINLSLLVSSLCL